MSNAIKSQGTIFEISNEDADATVYGSATWNIVGEVSDVGEPSGEAPDIDVTSLGSTAREYLIGLPEEGNIQIQGNFLPTDTGQLELIDAKASQNRRWIRITWTSGAIWYAKALVKKYAASAATDGKVPFTAAMRISGAWTHT